MTTINTCTSSTRPGSPSTGDTLFETDTESLITYDGSVWKSYGADDGNYNLDGTNITSVRPECHFDAEFFNGIDTSGNPANDSSVNTSTVWKSRVDNSITLSQSVAASQPLYKTSGINSKPYVYCDGGDYLYFSKGFALPGEFTTFAIAESTNSNPPTIFGGSGVNITSSLKLSAEANFVFGYSSNTYYLYFQQTGANQGAAPLAASTNIRSLLVSRDGSSNTKLFMDGNNQGSAVATNSDAQFVGQVFHGMGGAYDMTGNVYELMLFKTSLSNADMNALGAYAQAKYGSSNLGWTNF
jgi:hypothetical protein